MKIKFIFFKQPRFKRDKFVNVNKAYIKGYSYKCDPSYSRSYNYHIWVDVSSRPKISSLRVIL